jgi:hypothetical protein
MQNNITKTDHSGKNGKIHIHAQITSSGWKIVYYTPSGKWAPLTDAVFYEHHQALVACRELEMENPEKYHDDN